MYREAVTGRKWTQINGVDQKEERNIQPEQNKETRIQKKKKNEERLINLQYIFKCSNIRVWNFLRKLKMELPFDPAIPLLGL